MPLTDIAIRNAKPSAKPIKLFDENVRISAIVTDDFRMIVTGQNEASEGAWIVHKPVTPGCAQRS